MTANTNGVEGRENGYAAKGVAEPKMTASGVNGTPIRPFARPAVNFASTERLEGCMHSLPELVDFNAVNNASHPFCIQAASSGALDTITHGEFKVAVSRCAAWLKENLPIRPAAGEKALTKMAPVALFMQSDIGLVIHEFALMSIGVPVSLPFQICSAVFARPPN
jgi:hypothetical protein